MALRRNWTEISRRKREYKKLLKNNYKIRDGHNFCKNKFNNLSEFRHLDIIIYNKKEIKAICEVKTTKNKSKKEFKINGECGLFMVEAKKRKSLYSL